MIFEKINDDMIVKTESSEVKTTFIRADVEAEITRLKNKLIEKEAILAEFDK